MGKSVGHCNIWKQMLDFNKNFEILANIIIPTLRFRISIQGRSDWRGDVPLFPRTVPLVMENRCGLQSHVILVKCIYSNISHVQRYMCDNIMQYKYLPTYKTHHLVSYKLHAFNISPRQVLSQTNSSVIQCVEYIPRKFKITSNSTCTEFQFVLWIIFKVNKITFKYTKSVPVVY